MKKSITIILSSMMGLSLVACSSKPTTEEPIDGPNSGIKTIEYSDAVYATYENMMKSAEELYNYNEGDDDYDYVLSTALDDFDSFIQMAEMEDVTSQDEIVMMGMQYNPGPEAIESMKKLCEMSKDTYQDNEIFEYLATSFNVEI